VIFASLDHHGNPEPGDSSREINIQKPLHARTNTRRITRENNPENLRFQVFSDGSLGCTFFLSTQLSSLMVEHQPQLKISETNTLAVYLLVVYCKGKIHMRGYCSSSFVTCRKLDVADWWGAPHAPRVIPLILWRPRQRNQP